jgi:hypothetical protein
MTVKQGKAERLPVAGARLKVYSDPTATWNRSFLMFRQDHAPTHVAFLSGLCNEQAIARSRDRR